MVGTANVISVGMAIATVAALLLLFASGTLHYSPQVRTQAQLDEDCSRFLAQLNAEERSRGLPIYTFYRCENGGVANAK